jgi:hypothetical protein
MRFAQILAAMAAMGMFSFASAEGPTTKPKAQDVRGKIVKIDGTNIIVLTHEQGQELKEVTVQTDDKTIVTFETRKAKFEDLKAGMGVYITPAEGVAKKVNAWRIKHTEPPGKKDHYKGIVLKVEGADVTIRANVSGKETDVTLKTDDNTDIMIDGKESTIAGLKANIRATAHAVDGAAYKIVAFTHP